MRDVILGTAGRDLIEGSGRGDDIFGGRASDALRGEGGGDILHGQGGIDELQGDAGNDTLFGNAGGDLLAGGLGNDFLFGGAGDDLLAALQGSDNLTGAAGQDLFALSVNQASDQLGKVTVTDFGAGDHLGLSLLTSEPHLIDAGAALDTDGSGTIDAGDAHAHASARGLVIDLGDALDDATGGHGTTGSLTLSGLDHLDVSGLA